MKKDEIKIGRTYSTKVGARTVTVRIDSANSHGGWHATDTATGKRIRIRSAQRLRPAGRRLKPADDAQPDINPTVEVITGQPVPGVAGELAAKPKRRAKPPVEPKPKRVSGLDAAAQVLQGAGAPLGARALVDAMAAQGLWSSPHGKTPHATIYAAVLREINTKGAAARFRKVQRGLFAFNG